MPQKPWLKKTYTLILVPHAEAKFRKIKLRYSTLVLSCFGLIALTAVLAIFLTHYVFMLGDAAKVRELAKENVALQREKNRYEQLTSDIGHRIDLITEKTRVLSTLAGVDQVVNLDQGDIKGVDAQYGNEQLDRELPLQRSKLNNLQASLEHVEKAFNEKQEELDYTPSVWPIISTDIGWISSRLGYRHDPFTGKRAFHNGLDISARTGVPIIAPANGVVVETTSSRSLGNSLVIDHMNGYTTVYGHLEKFLVKKGDRVTRGQIIGLMGNTGRSTGPHLHYEVRLNGKAINPLRYILNYNTTAPAWDFQLAKR